MFFNERIYCDLRTEKFYELSTRKIKRMYIPHNARKLVPCGNSCALTENCVSIFVSGVAGNYRPGDAVRRLSCPRCESS